VKNCPYSTKNRWNSPFLNCSSYPALAWMGFIRLFFQKEKEYFRFAPHQFVKPGRGAPVLVTELRSCLAVGRKAEKKSLIICYVLCPICVSKGGKYSVRSGVSLPLFKTQFRPKTTKIESGELFWPHNVFPTTQGGTDRTGFSFAPPNLGTRSSWIRCALALKQCFASCFDGRTPPNLVHSILRS